MIGFLKGLLVFLLMVTGILWLVWLYQEKATRKANEESFAVVCLDGVEYYHLRRGHYRILAPKFSAETSSVSLCEEKIK